MSQRSQARAKPFVQLGRGALFVLLLGGAARVLAGEPGASASSAPTPAPTQGDEARDAGATSVSEPGTAPSAADAGADDAAASPAEPPPATASDAGDGGASVVPSWPFGAQDGTPGKRFESSEPRDPEAGKGTRTAGIVMTVGGAVVAVLGIVMLGEASASDDGSSDSYASALPNRIAGGAITALGGLVFLIGIPVWATGAAEMAKNEAPAAAWTPTVTVGPGAMGASWTF